MTEPRPRRSGAVLVRPARRADIGRIQDVARVANEEFRDLMGGTMFAGYLANVLDVESRMRSGRVLVAEIDGEVVGSISLFRAAAEEGMGIEFPARTAGLRATAVSPAARGRGIGMRLVEACLDEAWRSRARAVALHTAPYMVAARALYERVGFRRRPDLDFDSAPFFGGGTEDRLPAMGFVRNRS